MNSGHNCKIVEDDIAEIDATLKKVFILGDSIVKHVHCGKRLGNN